MNRFGIYKVGNSTVYGSFNLKKYNDLRVEFEFKNGVLSFDCPIGEREKINSFSKWLLNEKDFYTKFILNYFNEINKINDIFSFKGKITKEYSCNEPSNIKKYVLNVQYDELPTMVCFKFYPNDDVFDLLYQFPIPINSEGKYATGIYIEEILKKETIQRMWEPFRSKTKYRLQLLHMLR